MEDIVEPPQLLRRVAQCPRARRTRLSQPIAQPRIDDETAEGRGYLIHIRSAREDAARFVDYLNRTAKGRRNDGQPGGQRLDVGNAESFGLDVRLAVNIRCLEEKRNVGSLSEESNAIRDPPLECKVLELLEEPLLGRPLRAADHPADPSVDVSHSRQGVQVQCVPFPLLETADLDDDNIVRPGVEIRANRCAFTGAQMI